MLKNRYGIANKAARISLIHVVVITLSLIMTISVYQFSKYQIDKRTKARFEVSRDRALGLITERMGKYEDALWAGVSTIKSHGGQISYENWKTFSENLSLKEKYPGISGIGVIHYLSKNSVSDYLKYYQAERPDFSIHPAHDQSLSIPITFIEPTSTNAAAVGLDLAHETNRRTAALASRDSGTAQITGPIVLVQDAGSTPGFLFYAPFYEGKTPTTISERREQIVGAVYAPFVVRELMEGLLSKEFRQVRFDIRDGDALIYDEHFQNDALVDADPMFSESVSLDLYGRTWTMDMRTNLAFRANNSYAQPTFILIGGLLIELLIISLLVLMSRANGRAIAYADEVTAALRVESGKLADTNIELEETITELAKKNDELEQFAYVASHDLKTPVRGIGVLTEIIEEDLDEYMLKEDANPDVRENLTRITERVDRMNDLINGVMAFSRINAVVTESIGLRISTIMNELRSDFGLTAEQLMMVGEDEIIGVDSFNFRRVIENLISNAIKHGHSGSGLVITVTVTRLAEKLRVAVADNGPGIAEVAHKKIFDVFQTMRPPGMKESTGIGLAIVKKAVERHSGKVTVTSTLGSGATFAFDWPTKDREYITAPSSEAA